MAGYRDAAAGGGNCVRDGASDHAGANYGKKYPGKTNPSSPRPAPSRPAVAESTPPPAPPHVDAHLASIEQIHRQMAEAHTAAQRAMSEAHIAYLHASQAAFAQLGIRSSSEPTEIRPAPNLPAPAPFGTAPVVSASFEPKTAAKELLPSPGSASRAEPVRSENLTDLVLNVVAEKTGYPRDILRLDMDLEADLGIDSIKRVQILSAVSQERPDLPQADGQAMAGLRTLKAIIDHLSGSIAPVSVAIHFPACQQTGWRAWESGAWTYRDSRPVRRRNPLAARRSSARRRMNWQAQ